MWRRKRPAKEVTEIHVAIFPTGVSNLRCVNHDPLLLYRLSSVCCIVYFALPGKIDPTKPIPKPDPERWIARSHRAYGKRGRKRNKFVGAQVTRLLDHNCRLLPCGSHRLRVLVDVSPLHGLMRIRLGLSPRGTSRCVCFLSEPRLTISKFFDTDERYMCHTAFCAFAYLHATNQCVFLGCRRKFSLLLCVWGARKRPQLAVFVHVCSSRLSSLSPRVCRGPGHTWHHPKHCTLFIL